MESLNREGDNRLTRRLMAPNQTSGAGNGLHPVKWLAKGVPWSLPNITGYSRGYGSLSRAGRIERPCGRRHNLHMSSNREKLSPASALPLQASILLHTPPEKKSDHYHHLPVNHEIHNRVLTARCNSEIVLQMLLLDTKLHKCYCWVQKGPQTAMLGIVSSTEGLLWEKRS